MEEERARNRAALEDVSRRMGRVRDKLATVAAEAGPLFREATDLVAEMDRLLARSPQPAADPPSAVPAQEAIEFEGAE